MDKNKYDKAYSVRQEYLNFENKKISDTYYLPISLKKISITNATNIPNGGFINCSYLEEVNLLGNINKIGKEA